MSDRFVPFTPGDGDSLSRDAFVGLTNGQCDHSSEPSKVDNSQPVPDAPVPNIVLHRDGETIKAIEVECPCGQRVVLTCDYGDGSAN